MGCVTFAFFDIQDIQDIQHSTTNIDSITDVVKGLNILEKDTELENFISSGLSLNYLPSAESTKIYQDLIAKLRSKGEDK